MDYDLTLGVVIGIALSYLVYRLQHRHTLQIQKIEVFWRYRKAALDNRDLHNAMMDVNVTKDDPNKLQTLLDFYEEVGLHVSRDLIDLHLTDEILGDGIVAAYEAKHIQEGIKKIRDSESDDTYYEHFIDLGKQLSIKAQERKHKQ